MAAVGAYLSSLKEREETDEIDDKLAFGLVLKAVGRLSGSEPVAVPFATLVADTGLPGPTVGHAVNFLVDSGLLVREADDLVKLTGLGYRAQFVVSS